MQKTWIERDKMIHENNYQVISKNAGDEYTNYNIPVVFRDSLIIAVNHPLMISLKWCLSAGMEMKKSYLLQG